MYFRVLLHLPLFFVWFCCWFCLVVFLSVFFVVCLFVLGGGLFVVLWLWGGVCLFLVF